MLNIRHFLKISFLAYGTLTYPLKRRLLGSICDGRPGQYFFKHPKGHKKMGLRKSPGGVNVPVSSPRSICIVNFNFQSDF